MAGETMNLNTLTSFDGHNPFHLACANGDLGAVRFLLAEFPDRVNVNFPSTYDGTALRAAASSVHIDVVKILLSEGADLKNSDTGRSLLFSAAFLNHLDVVQLLCEHGANVNSLSDPDISVLQGAAWRGLTPIVEYLVEEYQASMSHRTQDGLTVLDMAVSHPDVVRVLLSYGAGAEDGLQESSNTLCRAVLRGCFDTVKLLVEYGANVNAEYVVRARQWDFVLTPLTAAVLHGNLEIVEYLCENGVDAELATDQNKTALGLAIGKGFSHIVEYLVGEQHVNVESGDSFGFTSAEVAESYEEVETLERLEEHEASPPVK